MDPDKNQEKCTITSTFPSRVNGECDKKENRNHMYEDKNDFQIHDRNFRELVGPTNEI